MKKLTVILLLALFSMTAASLSALEVPPLKSRVNDYAGMISETTEKKLENKLTGFEKSDSTQVVILTVDSLQGEVLESYSIRVAEKWKIGHRGKDNGVILFVSKNDRRIRIEVGRGLEGVLTDLLAGRIIDNIISPEFKKGNFDGGFVAGIDAIIQACRGEFKSAPENSSRNRSSSSNGKYSFIFLALLYFIVLGVSSFSRLAAGGIGAVSLPVLVHFLASPLSIGEALIAAAAGFILALIIPFTSSGGGSGGSSSWGGGSDSGGDFSGGGGSFGGGGSSGGW